MKLWFNCRNDRSLLWSVEPEGPLGEGTVLCQKTFGDIMLTPRLPPTVIASLTSLKLATSRRWQPGKNGIWGGSSSVGISSETDVTFQSKEASDAPALEDTQRQWVSLSIVPTPVSPPHNSDRQSRYLIISTKLRLQGQRLSTTGEAGRPTGKAFDPTRHFNDQLDKSRPRHLIIVTSIRVTTTFLLNTQPISPPVQFAKHTGAVARRRKVCLRYLIMGVRPRSGAIRQQKATNVYDRMERACLEPWRALALAPIPLLPISTKCSPTKGYLPSSLLPPPPFFPFLFVATSCEVLSFLSPTQGVLSPTKSHCHCATSRTTQEKK